MFRFLLVIFAIALTGPLAVQAQNNGTVTGPSTESFNYQAFQEAADRARVAIDDAQASDEAFLELRANLVAWREAASAAEKRRLSPVETARAQLAALGPLPEDGSSESTETAAKRANLQAALNEVEAPYLEAQAAFSRADGQISEIDALLRARQSQELVTLGPSPLSPANWSKATQDVRDFGSQVSGEVSDALEAPASRQIALDRLPITILMLIASAIMIWPWREMRFWQDRLGLRFSDNRRGWAILAWSIFALLAPVAGIVLGAFALSRTELFGLGGMVLLQALPLAGLSITGAIWLGWVLRSELGADAENSRDPLRLHRLSVLLGVGIALRVLLVDIANLSDWDRATLAVLRLPLTLIFSFGLFGFWFLSKPGRWLSEGLFPAEGPARRAVRYFRWALIGAAVAAPLVALLGYGTLAFNATVALTLTLALAVLCYVVFRLVIQLSSKFQAVSKVGDEERNTGVLLRFLLGLVLAIAAVPFLALIWGARTTELQELWTQAQTGFQLGETQVSPSDILTFVVVFTFGYILTRVIQATLRNTVLPNTSLDKGAQYALVAGTGYVGIFLAAVIAISATGIDLSGLAIVAGALSVGIGFGLQNIVSNFISGIILLIERPIKEGDWIEVGGTHGTVKNISVRSTEIQAFDRSMVIIPNADLVTGTMTNFTHRSLTGRVIVPVGVSYDADPRHVEKILLEIAEAQPRVLLNPAPYVVFQGFGASSMDFELRAIIRDVNWVLTVRSDINFEIAKRFKEEGIEIPFVQRDLNIRNIDEVAKVLKPNHS